MHRLSQFLPTEAKAYFLAENTDIYKIDYPVVERA